MACKDCWQSYERASEGWPADSVHGDWWARPGRIEGHTSANRVADAEPSEGDDTEGHEATYKALTLSVQRVQLMPRALGQLKSAD